MLSLLGKALNGIFDNPETVFLTAKVRDILFEGIVINCDRTDFAPKAVCTAIKKEAKNIDFFGNNQFRFSIFGRVICINCKKIFFVSLPARVLIGSNKEMLEAMAVINVLQ